MATKCPCLHLFVPTKIEDSGGGNTGHFNILQLSLKNRRIIDTLEDTKVVERPIPTKFEKREWFLENLRSLLSLDLNQNPSDEDSRSECLRLHCLHGVQ